MDRREALERVARSMELEDMKVTLGVVKDLLSQDGELLNLLNQRIELQAGRIKFLEDSLMRLLDMVSPDDPEGETFTAEEES